MSAAQDEVDRHHRVHPLRGHDRIARAFADLEPNLPQWAHDLRRAGKLAVAEIVTHQPRAETRTFTDGSYAILISSGFLRLLWAVAADIAGSVDVLPDRREVTATLSTGDAIARLVTTLGQLRDEAVATGGRALDLYPFKLSPWEEGFANELTHRAVLFTVGHELGHVSMRHNKVTVKTSLELESDMVGFLLLLASASRFDVATSYGGALLSLRLHAALETAGVKFHDEAATLAARTTQLKGLMLSARALAPGDGWAWAEAVIERLMGPAETALRALA